MTKFGDETISLDVSLSWAPPSMIALVDAVKASVTAQLKPGWHQATFSFKLNEEGNLESFSEYKITSWGEKLHNVSIPTKPPYSLEGWHQNGVFCGRDGTPDGVLYVDGEKPNTEGRWQHITLVFP